MKELFQAFITHFKAQPHNDLYTALSGKLYPDLAPQGTDMPYAVYTMVSGIPTRDLAGPSGERVVIQLDLYADTEAAIHDLYEKATALLDDCSLTVTGHMLIRFHRSFFHKFMEDTYKRYLIQYDVEIDN